MFWPIKKLKNIFHFFHPIIPKSLSKNLSQSPYFHSSLIRDIFGKYPEIHPIFSHIIPALLPSKSDHFSKTIYPPLDKPFKHLAKIPNVFRIRSKVIRIRSKVNGVIYLHADVNCSNTLVLLIKIRKSKDLNLEQFF